MSLCSRRTGLVLLLMFWAGLLAAQSRVNPTVKRLPAANAPVPVECEEGLAPQPMMRADLQDFVEERDPAADMLPPPSRDLRSALAAAQTAARNKDRESFRQALAASKTLLASYPPGGEKTAASEVVTVYDDLDRVWDYQYSSPVGSFFDASVQGGGLLATLQKYRGYDEFVRRQIYTDANGIRLYPTGESQDFLARESGERLARLGVRVTPPAPRVATGSSPAPASPRVAASSPPAPAARPVVQPAAPTTTPRQTTRRASSTPQKTTPRTQASRPATRRAAAKVEPIAQPPESEPPDSVPDHSIVATPPARTAAPPTSPPATADATATSTTGTGATSMDTTALDTALAAETAVGQDDARRPQTRTRSVILPIILILIGVGVLIVLFRASS